MMVPSVANIGMESEDAVTVLVAALVLGVLTMALKEPKIALTAGIKEPEAVDWTKALYVEIVGLVAVVLLLVTNATRYELPRGKESISVCRSQ